MSWLDGMNAGVAMPEGLAEWARTQSGYDAAWQSCPRADWAVWLAAADSRNDEERRDVVGGAAALADAGGVWSRTFRVAPRPLDRARLWVSPRSLGDIDAVVADWFRGLLVAALVVLPAAILMTTKTEHAGALRTILFSDLLTIPLAVVLTVAGYVFFRRRRIALARALPSLGYRQALELALNALKDRPASSTDAQIFRARMSSVYARTRRA